MPYLFPACGIAQAVFVLARGIQIKWRPMHRYKILFYFLPLLVMACTLTAQSAAVDALPIAKQTNPASPTPAPQVCHVKTGIEAGALNLRTCGGTACPVVIVLHEGETLTQTQTVNGWLAVETASGLHGWVNSKYLTCEVGK